MRFPVFPRFSTNPFPRFHGVVWLFLLVSWSTGCASLTNPVADGIPVRRLPEELKGASRAEQKPIPLTVLRQNKPEAHLVDAGDVLGIVIEGVLGDRNQPAPVRLGDVPGQTPAQGFPIPVQDDGTILVPYVDPIKVNGLTLAEAQEKIRSVYLEKEVLRKGSERIIVTLLQPRKYTVLVVREDGGGGGGGVSAGLSFGPAGTIIGSSKQGRGYSLELPAYENDILSALARSGGLPGTDAKNEIIIFRKNPKKNESGETQSVTRIPLRLKPDEPYPFKPEDIILNTGDILYIESREAEVFYTAGLLQAGQFPIPRDYDLDVIQAIALVRGLLLNGAFGQALFTPNATGAGLGSPSPSLVTILRRTANGGQVPIRVDLNLAFRDPRERINIQPGDIIVLQERPSESITRYVTQMLKFNFISTIVRQRDLIGTGTSTFP